VELDGISVKGAKPEALVTPCPPLPARCGMHTYNIPGEKFLDTYPGIPG